MDFKQLVCSLCNRVYSTTNRLPWIITMCGHTFCQPCIADRLEEDQQSLLLFDDDDEDVGQEVKENHNETSSKKRLAKKLQKSMKKWNKQSKTKQSSKTKLPQQGDSMTMKSCFQCPHDGIKSDINSIEQFPWNLALIKIIEKQMSQIPPDHCLIHKKKLQVVCVTCKSKVCPNCALFGAHIDHDIRPEQEVMHSITSRIEGLMNLYSSIDEERKVLQHGQTIDNQYTQFRSKQVELIQVVEQKFKQLKQALKSRQKVILQTLHNQFKIVDNKFNSQKQENNQIQKRLQSWSQRTKQTLDQLDPQNGDQIPFNMIESPENEHDLLHNGQKILTDLETKKKQPPITITLQKLVNLLGVQFNNDIQKSLTNFCTIPCVHNEYSAIDFTALSGGTATTAATLTTTFFDPHADFNPLNLAVDIVGGDDQHDFLKAVEQKHQNKAIKQPSHHSNLNLSDQLSSGDDAMMLTNDDFGNLNQAGGATLLKKSSSKNNYKSQKTVPVGMLSQSPSDENLVQQIEQITTTNGNTNTNTSTSQNNLKKSIGQGVGQQQGNNNLIPKRKQSILIPPPQRQHRKSIPAGKGNPNNDSKNLKKQPAALNQSNNSQQSQKKEHEQFEQHASDKTINSMSDNMNMSKFQRMLFEMEQQAADIYDFTGINLQEENLENLAQILSRSKQLKTLILAECNLNDQLCSTLLTSLHQNSALKILNLHSNQISEESTASITNFLKSLLAAGGKDGGLKTLILSNNPFQSKLIKSKLKMASRGTNILI